MIDRRWIGAFCGILLLATGLWAPFDGLSPTAQRALGIALFAILFWTTEPLPVELSSLIVLLLLPATGLLSFEQSFAPFAGKTVWLIFAGMVMSLGISQTGLGDRIAAAALRHLGRSPFRLLLDLHLIGLLASFLVPSGVVRVLLLFPIGISLADQLDPEKKTDLAAAVLLSLLCSTYFGGCGVFTGSVPNLVVAGQLERASGEIIYWATWFQWMFPVIGLLRTGLSLFVVWFLFYHRLPAELPAAQPINGPAGDSRQRRIIAILSLGVCLWATDVFHGVQPTFVALALALLIVLPTWGPLPFAHLRKINFLFLFYIAALFSLGNVLEISGFNQHLVGLLTRIADLEHYGWFGRHMAITLLAVPFDFLMDIAAVAGVITSPLLELGKVYGLSDLSVAMSTAMATTLVFLPYQAAPFMVAYSFRRFSLGQLIAAMLLISTLSLLLLSPLNILYWHWMGLL